MIQKAEDMKKIAVIIISVICCQFFCAAKNINLSYAEGGPEVVEAVVFDVRELFSPEQKRYYLVTLRIDKKWGADGNPVILTPEQFRELTAEPLMPDVGKGLVEDETTEVSLEQSEYKKTPVGKGMRIKGTVICGGNEPSRECSLYDIQVLEDNP